MVMQPRIFRQCVLVRLFLHHFILPLLLFTFTNTILHGHLKHAPLLPSFTLRYLFLPLPLCMPHPFTPHPSPFPSSPIQLSSSHLSSLPLPFPLSHHSFLSLPSPFPIILLYLFFPFPSFFLTSPSLCLIPTCMANLFTLSSFLPLFHHGRL